MCHPVKKILEFVLGNMAMINEASEENYSCSTPAHLHTCAVYDSWQDYEDDDRI